MVGMAVTMRMILSFENGRAGLRKVGWLVPFYWIWANTHGGMLGGISSGMPIVCRVAIKPTSSIPRVQRTVTQTGEATEILVKGRHAARFQGGRLGVLQGAKTWLLADEDGQIQVTHSVSAGLDYAAVGPEHCYLRDIGRVEYDYATDTQALAAFRTLAEIEGIIPALESAHAVAQAIKVAPAMKSDQIVIVNLSGRGDKDVAQAAEMLLGR